MATRPFLSHPFGTFRDMDGRLLETELRRLARSQHGVVSRAQARRAGATPKALGRRVRGPGWEARSARVLRLVGTPDTFAQRCISGALDAGSQAVVSRLSAAALWGLPGFSPGGVHVTRPIMASSRASRLATVHESRFLPAHHRTLHDGIPVTTVARTLFDLAGCLHPGRSERAVENALRHRFVDLEGLRRVTIELVARGRAGSALMRELLAARGAGYIPTASGLEADFLALVVAADLELPEGQVDLGGEGWIGRVDFYYRSLRLVIEIDSALYHRAKLDAEADERRDQALRAAGFEVMRITEEQLRDRPDEVVAELRAALAGFVRRSAPRNAPLPPFCPQKRAETGAIPGTERAEDEG